MAGGILRSIALSGSGLSGNWSGIDDRMQLSIAHTSPLCAIQYVAFSRYFAFCWWYPIKSRNQSRLKFSGLRNIRPGSNWRALRCAGD